MVTWFDENSPLVYISAFKLAVVVPLLLVLAIVDPTTPTNFVILAFLGSASATIILSPLAIYCDSYVRNNSSTLS
jgi:integral membrane sensor domain MASE1